MNYANPNDVLRTYTRILGRRGQRLEEERKEVLDAISEEPVAKIVQVTEGAGHMGDYQPCNHEKLNANAGINRIRLSTELATELAKKPTSREAFIDLVDDSGKIFLACEPLWHATMYATTQKSMLSVPQDVRPEHQYYHGQQGQNGGTVINVGQPGQQGKEKNG